MQTNKIAGREVRSRRFMLRSVVVVALVAGLSLLGAGSGVAQDFEGLSVRPLSPSAGEQVLATFGGTWPDDCPPRFSRDVEIDGREITLLVSNTQQDPPQTNCSPVATPYTATLTLGSLGESGPYDLEVVWVDTPFLPTSLGSTSFEVGPASLVSLQLPATANGSDPGTALVFGQWLEGCVPDNLRVESSPLIDQVSLVTDLSSTTCGSEYVSFALAVDLPVLPPGQRPVEYVVFDDVVGAQRASGMLDVGPAITRPRLNNERFEVAVTFDGLNVAKVAPGSTADTALFTFFDPSNLEMQVKVLDACGLNGHYWVFGAASTDLAFTIQVTDTVTQVVREYVNPAGQAAQAINDTTAFPCGS